MNTFGYILLVALKMEGDCCCCWTTFVVLAAICWATLHILRKFRVSHSRKVVFITGCDTGSFKLTSHTNLEDSATSSLEPLTGREFGFSPRALRKTRVMNFRGNFLRAPRRFLWMLRAKNRFFLARRIGNCLGPASVFSC